MKAMLLAAGLGTRLAPLTNSKPKCLIEVGGRTMLEHAVDRVRKAGVTSIVINTHYLAASINDFLRDKQNFGLRVTTTFEPEILDVVGGVLNAEQHLSDVENFFVYSTDVFSTASLSALAECHQKHGAIATLYVDQRPTQRSLLFDSSGRMVGFEYPSGAEMWSPTREPSPRNFKGIWMFSRKIFDLCRPAPRKLSLIDGLRIIAKSGHFVQKYEEPSAAWFDMGTPERLQRLREWVAAHPETP